MSPVSVREIEVAIARRFPPERAESWDRVGLLAGDPSADVTGVTLALDATPEALAATAAAGHNVLVTHHPAFLDPPLSIVAGTGPGGLVHQAVNSGISIINAHTNLDRDPAAQRLLPELLGLTPAMPLESASMPMSMVTVYVPGDFAERVRADMAAAGAGRIGDYTECSFASGGTGRFSAPDEAQPFTGAAGRSSAVDELRVEMVCPRSRAGAVVAAAVAAHPYEEPLVTTSEIGVARNAAALGMVCEAPEDTDLAALTQTAKRALDATPRVWGAPEAPAGVVATTTGSGGSLIPAALATGANTLICGEVRYHDALDARAAGLSIIELGHDVSEWPLVGLLAQTVAAVQGIAQNDVVQLPPQRGWWTR